MTHVIAFAVLTLMTSPAHHKGGLCEQLKRLGQRQPLFMSHAEQPGLRFDATAHKAVGMPVRAPSGNYYFATVSDGADTLRVFGGDDNDWLISWPDHPGRSIDAAWVNAKLLYLEISVTPSVSVYWIIDVETRSVVATEIEHDGSQAWNQCFPDRPAFR
jgi:hypothetical protein